MRVIYTSLILYLGILTLFQGLLTVCTKTSFSSSQINNNKQILPLALVQQNPTQEDVDIAPHSVRKCFFLLYSVDDGYNYGEIAAERTDCTYAMWWYLSRRELINYSIREKVLVVLLIGKGED